MRIQNLNLEAESKMVTRDWEVEKWETLFKRHKLPVLR